MGGAVMIGLGVALAQPDVPVVVITGDGEALMGLGAFATVGLQQPKNFSIVVLDNECYGETGGQVSHTGGTVDLAGVAKNCGIADVRTIVTMAEVESFAPLMQDVSSGPRLATVKISDIDLERVLANRDGTFVMNRVRGALGFGAI